MANLPSISIYLTPLVVPPGNSSRAKIVQLVITLIFGPFGSDFSFVSEFGFGPQEVKNKNTKNNLKNFIGIPPWIYRLFF